MRLEEIVSGAPAIPLALIGGDPVLTRQVQGRLGDIGLVDPPADGSFGPVSNWGITQYLRKIGAPSANVLDASSAKALLSDSATRLFPLNTPNSLAGRIVAAMQAAGYWLCRHPDCVNIIYIEGMDPDGTPNTDAPNVFNDLRLVLRINRSGNPEIVEAWEATSEPGKHYTLIEKLDPRGAARIAFGQYKAWSVGIHGKKENAHEALVQTASIRVHRDLNQDFERTGDAMFQGVFGLNQHWGCDMPKSNIGRTSAGCLVGRTKTGHRAFMKLCKADPRFVANNSYRFMTTVLPADAVARRVIL